MKIFAKTAKHDTNVAYILVGWAIMSTFVG